MRLFVAVNLPDTVRNAIYDDAAPVRAASARIKWVAPASLHVTLKFLGQQDDRLVGELERGLRSVGRKHAPIDVKTQDFGAFPNFRRPRVVWLGMTGAEPLRMLAADVDQVFATFGIPVETRPFRAHLTLGRVKDELTLAEAKALALAADRRPHQRRFTIRTIDLMQSELGPGGSRYSVLAAVPLHARGT